jgi:multidrug efflux pump subunit AcrA (membrane-fusion protein)
MFTTTPTSDETITRPPGKSPAQAPDRSSSDGMPLLFDTTLRDPDVRGGGGRFFRRLLLLCVVAGLCAAAVYAVTGRRPTSTSGPAIATAEVSLDSQRQIFAPGVIEGGQREVPLRFELSGRLIRIDAREGHRVRRGAVLAQLDPELNAQIVKQAEANLKLAENRLTQLVNGARMETREVSRAQVSVAIAEVKQARRDLLRGEALYKKRAIAQEEWEDRQHAYDQSIANYELAKARLAEVEAPARQDEVAIAKAAIDEAQAQLNQARTQLGRTSLRAPSDGLVLRVAVEPGQLTGPDSSEPAIIMTNAQQLRVRAYVEEMDASAVKPGQKAYAIADGDPDRRYPGTIVSCVPYMIPKPLRSHEPAELVDVKVREVVMELEDPGDLVIGLPVDVFIHPGSASNAEN